MLEGEKKDTSMDQENGTIEKHYTAKQKWEGGKDPAGIIFWKICIVFWKLILSRDTTVLMQRWEDQGQFAGIGTLSSRYGSAGKLTC